MVQLAFSVGGSDAIARVLKVEQQRAALASSLLPQRKNVPDDELRATSKAERQGASLLRMILECMDVVIEDNHVVIFRVILPHELMMVLEMWDADGADMEPSHDNERHDYLEMAG